MNSWQYEEARLWNAMQDPGRGRRKLTFHSIPPDRKRRKQLSERIEKQKQADFAAGWRHLRELLEH